MLVNFLTPEQVAQYGHYAGEPTPMQLVKYFHLDDGDMHYIRELDKAHTRLGFAVQLGTVRFLGTFLTDMREVPPTVIQHMAAQLAVDVSAWLEYGQRHNSSTGDDVYGRALNNSGQPTGSPFPIQETAGAQQRPALAYGANGRSQLAWQDDREGGWDLYTASLDRRYQVTYIEYTYDPLYRLTNASYSGDLTADYTYTYDPVGNMTAYTETVGITTTVVYRTFDAANQLQTATDTELGTTSFYYDGNGQRRDHHPPPVWPVSFMWMMAVKRAPCWGMGWATAVWKWWAVRPGRPWLPHGIIPSHERPDQSP